MNSSSFKILLTEGFAKPIAHTVFRNETGHVHRSGWRAFSGCSLFPNPLVNHICHQIRLRMSPFSANFNQIDFAFIPRQVYLSYRKNEISYPHVQPLHLAIINGEPIDLRRSDVEERWSQQIQHDVCQYFVRSEVQIKPIMICHSGFPFIIAKKIATLPGIRLSKQRS